MGRKVLLMGKSGSGKTSMRSIIFANYLARDTMRLGPTTSVENSQVRFLGNLILNLWDCGGQDAFMENYFESQRDSIFRNVEVLIYVFDASSEEEEKDMAYYRSCVDALRANSSRAHIFALVHKMDLLSEEERDAVAGRIGDDVARASDGLELTVFRTSIWDETLYKAWSSMVYALVPNVASLQVQLDKFCGLCEADEVVLFERATFLVISHATRVEHYDVHRFEKVSNIVKQFKLSCNKTDGGELHSIVLRGDFTCFISGFTQNTFIMATISDPTITSAAVELNLAAARQHFEGLMSNLR